MKLHWSSRSPFVRKVMITVHELQLVEQVELLPATVTPFAPDASVRAINPLIKIPTLVTGSGDMLYDSVVICEYLDNLNGTPRLFPSQGAQRIRALTLHAMADGLLEMLILWMTVRSRLPGDVVEALVNASRTKFSGTVDWLEQQAEGWNSNDLNIGTLTVGVALGYADFRFPDLAWRDGRPRLHDWYQRFTQRASAQATAPHD